LKNLTGKKCAWCHKKVGLHRDHIWPKSKGGSNKKENIQIFQYNINRMIFKLKRKFAKILS